MCTTTDTTKKTITVNLSMLDDSVRVLAKLVTVFVDPGHFPDGANISLHGYAYDRQCCGTILTITLLL